MCGRLMSPAHETQSMREIRLLRGRLPRKGGGLTGMVNYEHSLTVHVYAVIHFVIELCVVFLRGSQYVQVYYCLFISVLWLEIPLLRMGRLGTPIKYV